MSDITEQIKRMIREREGLEKVLASAEALESEEARLSALRAQAAEVTKTRDALLTQIESLKKKTADAATEYDETVQSAAYKLQSTTKAHVAHLATLEAEYEQERAAYAAARVALEEDYNERKARITFELEALESRTNAANAALDALKRS
jgi:chromosome segregation ATPase